ncbi:MAG TPA: UDP-N-acetylmuramate--L-alanine ligase [Dissulfurispiraceae bacterium]|nr:UDP-N-acetylmuramate--L-alanine ligase [Dissulfurispiraceae bacterium]
MFTHYRALHFVGIGGVGMSGIAEVLHNLGYDVTGSDAKESETTVRLRDLGIRVFIGHHPSNIGRSHVVVVSSAVKADNPEVVSARSKAVPVITRAEMLAELGRLKYGVLVAGAHGKTTTTSLIATIVGEGGLDPTVVIGGKLKAIGSNAKLGQGEFLVAEADESDGSFLKLSPTIAVITNIDKEHMDFFHDMDSMKRAFLSFINKVPFYGIAIVCIENEHVREILPHISRRCVTYGLTESADIYAKNITNEGPRMQFDAFIRGESLGTFILPMPGIHNVLNSLSAIAAAMELRIPVEIIRRALASFGGIHRRFERKGEVAGILVYDDYGHHPAEILAVLSAARRCFGDHRIVAAFQPHRYSRTHDQMEAFAACFRDADRLYLLDIYAAGEKPIEGVSSAVLCKKIAENGFADAYHLPDKESAAADICDDLKPGDVVFTLGAGDVYKVGERILQIQASRSRSQA